MRLLADTHAVIWLLLAPEKLSGRVAAALADPANLVLVSAVSGYEIEFKRPRSAELQRLPGDLQEGLVRFGFDWCAVEPSDAIAAGRLPRLHGDPFDRLITAQALARNMAIVTIDPAIRAYGAPAFW